MRFKGKKSEMVEVQIDALEFLKELKDRLTASLDFPSQGRCYLGDGNLWKLSSTSEAIRMATEQELAFIAAWTLIENATKEAKEKKLV